MHSPGVHFTREEVIAVARLLDAARVDEIEVGIFGAREPDGDLVRTVVDEGLRASISSLVLCRSVDQVSTALDEARRAGVDAVCLSIPTSRRFIEAKLGRSERAVLVLMRRCVEAAVERGLRVAFSGEDAARADVGFLTDYVAVGAEAGASRFRFAESVSCLDPVSVGGVIAALTAASDIAVEVHCHSAYGLAVANTCAAVAAGATWASVTVDGLGERGGNTPLGPVMLYANTFLGESFATTVLTPLSRLLDELTAGGQAHFRSITGVGAFQYEYLHQYESPSVYEAFPPELVGNERSLVLGTRFDEAAWTSALRGHGDAARDDGLRRLIVEEVRATRRGVTPQRARTLAGALAAPDHAGTTEDRSAG